MPVEVETTRSQERIRDVSGPTEVKIKVRLAEYREEQTPWQGGAKYKWTEWKFP